METEQALVGELGFEEAFFDDSEDIFTRPRECRWKAR
jgi:hypothetical protein